MQYDLYAPTATTAGQIVHSSNSNTQVLFRVPKSLRDDLRRLALDEDRRMDAMLTEALLDLMSKYDRTPRLFDN